MVPGVALILLGGGFIVAFGIAASMLAVPRRLRIYAHPNVRSFHDRPTPTSGGIAFVVPIAAYLAWLGFHGADVAAAVAAGGGALALMGLRDDRRDVAKSVRLILQLTVCAGVAWTMLPPAVNGAGWFWLAVTAVVLAWQVNLYNFMDGIDGLAGAQALVFAVGVQVAGVAIPGWPGDLLWLTAGSVLGFLVVNWPPARLFMGDVGSYFLGLLTGAVAILLWREDMVALPVSLILLAGFWFDATYTLIVRASTGQAFTQPHRTHLYQKIAAKRGHLWTTVCYLLYAGIWLLPLSWLCTRYSAGDSLAALLWVLPAVTPMVAAAWWLGAGRPDSAAPGSAAPGSAADERHDQ